MDVEDGEESQRNSDTDEDEVGGNNLEQNNSQSLLRFRNYTPQTKFLEGLYRVDKAEPSSIDSYIEDKINLISDNDYTMNDNDNKHRINPEKLNLQKIDADLKRRIEKRLDKLENETRRQIDKHVKTQKNKNR